MMRYIYFFLICFISLLIAKSSFCQDNIQKINLETVLKLCGANNLTIKEYNLQYQEAHAKHKKSKEWWLPNIYAGVRTHYLNGAAMNTDGNIFTDLDRNYAWYGAGIDAEIDFNKGVFQSSALKQRTAALNYYGIAEKNKIVLQAIQAYYDLQSEQIKYSLLQNLEKEADTLAQQLKTQTDAGLRFESELLLAQSNVGHLQVTALDAKLNWQKHSALLVQLLNIENRRVLLSAEPAPIAVNITATEIDSNKFKNRGEYNGLQFELKAIDTEKKGINQGLLYPKLNVGIDNGQFGEYSGINNNTSQLNAALTWKIPFGRLMYHGDGKVLESKKQIIENEIEQFKKQFNAEEAIALASLSISKQKLDIGSAALKHTTEALNQSRQRQKIGTAKPFEVFQTQEMYLRSQMDYIKSVADYNKAHFELKVARGEQL